MKDLIFAQAIFAKKQANLNKFDTLNGRSIEILQGMPSVLSSVPDKEKQQLTAVLRVWRMKMGRLLFFKKSQSWGLENPTAATNNGLPKLGRNGFDWCMSSFLCRFPVS